MSDETTARRTIPLSGKLDNRRPDGSGELEDLPEDLQRILSGRANRIGSAGRTTLQKLEGKHVMSMILFISDMSPVLKTDIYTNVARSSGMSDKLDDLYAMGLIKIYRTAQTNSQVVVITEKGKKIAELIKDMVGLADGYERLDYS